MKKTILIKFTPVIWILTAAAASVLFTGCGTGDKSVQATEITKENAQHISHITGGLIEPDDPIRVRFVQPAAGVSLNTPLENNPFYFSPSIRGTALWEDRQTLVFIPGKPLRERTEYSASLNISKFLNNGSGDNNFNFTFQTKGTELTGLTDEFIPENPSDPGTVRYKGKLIFNMAKNTKDIQKNVELTVNGQTVSLQVETADKESGAYAFSSGGIQRDEKRKLINLTVKKGIGLEESFTHTAYLEPLNVFTVTDISSRDEGRSTGIHLQFTDELETSQNIEGLITLTPPTPVSLKTYGKDVYLQGDFKRGEKYTVTVNKNIKSKRGTKVTTPVSADVEIENVKPQMEFIHSGVFLPSSGNNKIYFKTVNLRSVNVSVMQVFDNNLGQFLQTEQLASNADRSSRFNSQYVNRVGVTVADTKLSIGEDKNKWLVQELDLSELINPEEKGLYLISITFDKDDMIYPLDEDQQYYYGDEYYTNPNSRGYLYAHGRIYKPVMVSDIGLTWKAGIEEHAVFATDILTAAPLQGVKVTIRTYQNQIIAEGITNSDGTVNFKDIEKNSFYMTGELGDQRSVVKANEMAWNLSSFNTGGSSVNDEGIRAFLYTDRGVYRPGDTIHLSAIIRNRNNTFPANHPVELKLYNPRGQVYLDEVNTSGTDGFYHFEIKTQESDPTGNWSAQIKAGSETFTLNSG